MNPKNKPNGHGALLAKGSGANARTISLNGLGRAASDDASELSVANATAVSAAAGAERKAYADVAQAEGGGEQYVMEKAHAAPQSLKSRRNKTHKEANPGDATRRDVVPGLEPLPVDGEAFVDAVHAQVDLVQLEVDLLSSMDDKLVQRELAYLRELRYGKRAAAPADDEPIPFIFDAPRPERELP